MYGGQAVIEGVMIRGRDFFGLAVRRQDGTIEVAIHAMETAIAADAGEPVARQVPSTRVVEAPGTEDSAEPEKPPETGNVPGGAA